MLVEGAPDDVVRELLIGETVPLGPSSSSSSSSPPSSSSSSSPRVTKALLTNSESPALLSIARARLAFRLWSVGAAHNDEFSLLRMAHFSRHGYGGVAKDQQRAAGYLRRAITARGNGGTGGSAKTRLGFSSRASFELGTMMQVKERKKKKTVVHRFILILFFLFLS